MVGLTQATRDAIAVVPLMCREQLRWLSASLAVQVHAMGLITRSKVIDPDDPYLPEELFDYEQIRANAGKGIKNPQHWSAKVNWNANIFKLLPPKFVEARLHLLLAEVAWWRDDSPRWNGKWIRDMGGFTNKWRYRSDASGFARASTC